MKSQWKPREKAVKNPQNQACAKNAKRIVLRFCDQFFSWVLPLYVAAADLTVRNFWFFSRYEFFEAFSHLGPLL